jgi:hypothetical protein
MNLDFPTYVTNYYSRQHYDFEGEILWEPYKYHIYGNPTTIKSVFLYQTNNHNLSQSWNPGLPTGYDLFHMRKDSKSDSLSLSNKDLKHVAAFWREEVGLGGKFGRAGEKGEL